MNDHTSDTANAPSDAAGNGSQKDHDDRHHVHAPLTVRAAGLRDLSAIHALYEEFVASQHDLFADLGTNSPMVAWTLRRSRQQLLAEERWIAALVENREGAVVGYAAALMEQQASIYKVQHYGSFSEVYVSDAYRRHGLGTQLIALVIATLKLRGIELVEAHAPAADAGALAFLASLGFRTNQVQLYRTLDLIEA